MSPLDDYRTALLAALPETRATALDDVLAERGDTFASFIVDHGLGPLWHERTRNELFHESRMQAEALYLTQEHALREIDAVLDGEGIEYAVIKGAANRCLLYENPAIRACHDLDLLVRPNDRVAAANVLIRQGFVPLPKSKNISLELLLAGAVDVDLHWRLLREGRLRNEDIDGMFERRRRVAGQWMLDIHDAAFLMLVHPALVKHLSGWEMGLHRVADLVALVDAGHCDWGRVRDRLEENDVRTAAWATLRWLEFLTQPATPPLVIEILNDLAPGRIRRSWLDRWLLRDMSSRTFSAHWIRLIFFSLALHDDLAGVGRVIAGRVRAHRRREADLALFANQTGQ